MQDALASACLVLTVSVHEYFRCHNTVAVDDRGGGMARNLPVPPGFNDSEMAFLLDEVLAPLGEEFAPEAVVIQCGADALADDPMSKLELSNEIYWRVVDRMRRLAPRVLVLGGGGYNPWAVARCWAGIWATLHGIAIPDRAPAAAEAVLRGLWWNRRPARALPEHWLTTLCDRPNPGPVRAAVAHVARQAQTAPVHGAVT